MATTKSRSKRTALPAQEPQGAMTAHNLLGPRDSDIAQVATPTSMPRTPHAQKVHTTSPQAREQSTHEEGPHPLMLVPQDRQILTNVLEEEEDIHAARTALLPESRQSVRENVEEEDEEEDDAWEDAEDIAFNATQKTTRPMGQKRQWQGKVVVPARRGYGKTHTTHARTTAPGWRSGPPPSRFTLRTDQRGGFRPIRLLRWQVHPLLIVGLVLVLWFVVVSVGTLLQSFSDRLTYGPTPTYMVQLASPTGISEQIFAVNLHGQVEVFVQSLGTPPATKTTAYLGPQTDADAVVTLAIKDVNGDGKPDVVVTIRPEGLNVLLQPARPTTWILLNNGKGGLVPQH